MKSLVHYLYVNRSIVDDYASQLTLDKPQKALSKITSKASVSIGGPKLESNREYQYSEAPLHDRLQRLEEKLEKLGLLLSSRPTTMRDLYGRYSVRDERPAFVKETVVATKIVFPAQALENLRGVDELAVWVADPPNHLPAEEYDFSTSFLLLSQIAFDREGVETTHSGCSALQAVMNGYEGNYLLMSSAGEPLGRGSFLHPIEKLQSRGGIASRPQRITALYRIRYMSDEQCYKAGGRNHRVYDVLGYPLYIAAA